MDQVKIMEGSLEKTLLGPFLNTLSHIHHIDRAIKLRIFNFKGAVLHKKKYQNKLSLSKKNHLQGFFPLIKLKNNALIPQWCRI